MRIPALILISAVVLLTACGGHTAPRAERAVASSFMPASTQPDTPHEGRLAVQGGSIWYRVSGSAARGTPVILLHGGPGYSSYYLKPFEALANDRPVVRYDQLGGGRSDRTNDTTLMTISHFVGELDALRAHLGYDRVHLVGHSWGTILAFEYYRAHPEHVVSLTLESPALDIPTWERNARRMLTTLPDSMQRAIRTREAEGRFDAPDYQAAVGEFMSRFVMRRPVQPDLDSLMSTVNERIYNYMQGPSEFTITGTLKRYDVTPLLGSVHVPVLYTVGEFDEADPPTVRHLAELTPGAKVVVIPNAAHITQWDAPEANTAALRDFLHGVDASGRR